MTSDLQAQAAFQAMRCNGRDASVPVHLQKLCGAIPAGEEPPQMSRVRGEAPSEVNVYTDGAFQGRE
eukprot:4463170-Alexandrium_andersonii.AAC.1